MPKNNIVTIIATLLIWFLPFVCNAGDEVKGNASIPWNGKTCLVPIENISEAEALKYTSLAVSIEVSKKDNKPQTLEMRYKGKCPMLIQRHENHLYYLLGHDSSRSRFFIFEIKENSLVFNRIEMPGCK